MDLKCRTTFEKTAWPGEGMQLLKNMGFKTAAMHCVMILWELTTRHFKQKRSWLLFSEQRETGFPHRRLQIAIIQ